MLLSELQSKDIINIRNGNNLGRIIDARIDEAGKVTYFVIEEKKLVRRVTRSNETSVYFEKIKKIGEDVILVEM